MTSPSTQGSRGSIASVVFVVLYLSRSTGETSARTEASAAGLLIVDHAADGPIGVEITAPEAATLDRINAVLERLGGRIIGPAGSGPSRPSRRRRSPPPSR